MPEKDPFIADLADAISSVFAKYGESETAAGVITGLVVVVEQYGTDGQTWTTVISDTPHWARTLGMLEWAKLNIVEDNLREER